MVHGSFDDSHYIGGSGSGGDYRWEDGTPFRFTAWSAGPPGGGDVCVRVEAGGWTSGPCDETRKALCELE